MNVRIATRRISKAYGRSSWPTEFERGWRRERTRKGNRGNDVLNIHCYYITLTFKIQSSSVKPLSTSFTISFKYGVACQHVYPLAPTKINAHNAPGNPITANTREKKTEVTIMSAYPMPTADSPDSLAKPRRGANHPGAATEESGGFMRSLTKSGTSKPSSFALTIREDELLLDVRIEEEFV